MQLFNCNFYQVGQLLKM